jgi:hypothetical protein
MSGVSAMGMHWITIEAGTADAEQPSSATINTAAFKQG